MQKNKKKVNTNLNRILFPSLNIQGFFNGSSKKDSYMKFKSTIGLSKYDLKVFLFDVYGLEIDKIHSKIERSKKKSIKKSKQKKIFWLKKTI